MSHEIEQYADGSGSMVSTRGISPWHRLGLVVRDEALTAADALRLARADFEVRKVPMFIANTELHTTGVETIYSQVPDRMATVRDDPENTAMQRVLGVVGKDYQVIQNADVFQLCDDIVDSGEAKYETAGVLRGGALVFLCMKLPEGVTVGGADPYDLYLVAATSHDTTMACRLMVTPVRVVCRNTLDWAISSAKQTWATYHTANADRSLDTARRELGIAFEYRDEFAATAERLLATPFSEAEFDQLVRSIDAPKDEAGNRAWDNYAMRRDQLMYLFREADTNEFGRGTAYAAVNAVGEFEDWLRTQASDGSAAFKTLFSSTVRTRKQQALDLALIK